MVRKLFDPHTLRGRLTIAYSVALFGGMAAFALAGYLVLKAMERATLDQQLQTAAAAVGAIVEVRDGKVALEHSDRTQFFQILGMRLSGAVVDASGNVVISNVSAPSPKLLGDVVAANSAGAFTTGSGENGARVARRAIVDDGRTIGYVAAWRPLDWFEHLDRLLLLGAAAAMVLISVPAISVCALIARRGLQPLERIADVASEIEAHDLALRLDDIPDERDELGRLAHTFNRMLDRLERAFERERRFAADASHELRAPLAVIAAETGLALRREREPESYRQTLRTISGVVAEIENVTASLLEAARSEAGSREEAVDLAELAHSTVERVLPLAIENGIVIEIEADQAVAGIADREALRRALLAVVHNALKFAPRGGTVRVTVVRDDGKSVVRVADDGPGFSAEGLEHATERFWRDDRARTPGTGSGLGLAIARASVERAGGSITLANRQSGGAVVSFELKHA